MSIAPAAVSRWMINCIIKAGIAFAIPVLFGGDVTSHCEVTGGSKPPPYNKQPFICVINNSFFI